MSSSRRRPHIALRRKTFERPSRRRWVKKQDDERIYYSDVDELRAQISNVKKSTERREKAGIYIDDNLYFDISIRGVLFWQSVRNVLSKLSLKLKKIISDKRGIFSLKRQEYERFHSLLSDHLDVIENISEVSVFHKINESIYNELKQNLDKIDNYTIEFSALSGIDNSEKLDITFTRWVISNNGEITRNYFSDTLMLYTVNISNQKIINIVDSLDAVSQVERRPQIQLSSGNLELDFLKNGLLELETPDTLPIICIIDSGINGEHARVKPYVEATYDFSSNDPYPCEDEVGHGTLVSGFAIYGEDPVGNRPSARVIMIKNFKNATTQIVDDINAIQNVLRMFPNEFKIMNLSYSSRGPNSSLTKVLDKIVFDNKLVIVTSSGNINREDILNNIAVGIPYPEYIKRYPIYYPGDCRNVITVGSCTQKSTNLAPVLGPSPFTRSSPYKTIVKPDTMEIGGNYGLGRMSNVTTIRSNGFGVISTSHMGQGFNESYGSSFSSPIVANMAAQLYSQIHIESPALIKALLLSSCDRLQDSTGNYFDTDTQGFGKPNLGKALSSDISRVSYLLEGGFSSRYPKLYDRYEIWFPDNADAIEVTVVCEKSETLYAKEENDHVYFNVMRRAGTGGRTEFIPLAGNQRCFNTFKARYAVSRGSRGPWTIGIIPEYSAGNLYRLRMRYGCVVTAEDTSKQTNIWDNIHDNWLVERIEEPIPLEEDMAQTMEPLKPIIVEGEIQ